MSYNTCYKKRYIRNRDTRFILCPEGKIFRWNVYFSGRVVVHVPGLRLDPPFKKERYQVIISYSITRIGTDLCDSFHKGNRGLP